MKILTKEFLDKEWFVLPVHKDEVCRDACASNEEAHAHLKGPHIQRQED